MSRELRGLPLLALLIDGVHFAEHVVLAAEGVDEQGAKHVLGLREGPTEKAAAVRALLGELVKRGLDTNRSKLVVIDGAKALNKAVAEVFGVATENSESAEKSRVFGFAAVVSPA